MVKAIMAESKTLRSCVNCKHFRFVRRDHGCVIGTCQVPTPRWCAPDYEPEVGSGPVYDEAESCELFELADGE